MTEFQADLSGAELKLVKVSQISQVCLARYNCLVKCTQQADDYSCKGSLSEEALPALTAVRQVRR